MLVLAARTILAAFGEDRNQLALHGERMAQCAPLDAAALGLVTKEIIELREDLAEMKRAMRPSTGALLSRQQVANRLGVSVRHVDRLVADGDLPPGRRVGKRLRWRLEDIRR